MSEPTTITADTRVDLRPLSHRVAAESGEVMEEMIRGPVIQSILAGTLSRDKYGELMGQLALIHAKLDAVIMAERPQFPELARLATDSRLIGDSPARDAVKFGANPAPKPLGSAAALIEAIEHIARFEPFKLIGLHFAREAARNVNKYLAAKLRAAYGDEAGARDGYEYLDPYRTGQRPIWERFKRDFDKMRLTEPERQALVSGARMFFERVVRLHGDLEAPMPEGELRKLPVGI